MIFSDVAGKTQVRLYLNVLVFQVKCTYVLFEMYLRFGKNIKAFRISDENGIVRSQKITCIP